MRFPIRNTVILAGLALVASAACGGYDGPTGMSVQGDVNIVLNAPTKGPNAFAPHSFTVSLASGGSVVWANQDVGTGMYPVGTTHTVTADDLSFTSGNIGAGSTYTHVFATTGTFTYHCSIHPTMTGQIVVTN